jgi:hypothetical protein
MPATAVQVVIDATDPHAVAAFWAAALHYEVEDHSDRIEQLLQAGHVPPEATLRVGDRLAFVDLDAISDPDGAGPRLLFQRVPEAKTVKNRVHLDLAVGADVVDDEVARLTGLGATYAWTSDDRGTRAVTMRDIEGNEFCVA